MITLSEKIEAILFIAGKPMSVKKLAEICKVGAKETQEAAKQLCDRYAESPRGIIIMHSGDSYQMATQPDAADLVTEFIKSEQTGELTKPSLETLTIIAYRGPIAKSDIEQIRGVNCSLILRNLLIKGLIEAEFDRTTKTTVYAVTMPLLEFLGVSSVDKLPEYERLHDDERLKTLLTQAQDAAKKTEPKNE